MARSLENKPNVVAPGGDYPYGRLKDKTASENGTPVNEVVYGDMHQFFEKLMNNAGITANEMPDNESNGFQLFEALLKANLIRETADNLAFNDDDFQIELEVLGGGTASIVYGRYSFIKTGREVKLFAQVTVEVTSLGAGNNYYRILIIPSSRASARPNKTKLVGQNFGGLGDVDLITNNSGKIITNYDNTFIATIDSFGHNIHVTYESND